jgi:DNA invertase Pin-like site-specific DNA recombinase
MILVHQRVPKTDVSGTILCMDAVTVPPTPETTPPHNRIRVGYARVSTHSQDHQSQLDALAGAHCREVVVETASTRKDRPKLRATLGGLRSGDTLVTYKPDRVARSMKELLVFVEDELHARGIVLEILTGVCAGVHRPDGAGLADRLLFAVAALAAEMERELIRERTLDGLRAAAAARRRIRAVPVHLTNLVLMVVPRLLALQIRLHTRRISHPDLRRHIVDHHGRYVERILQEPAQMANRHELKAEPQPVVITTLGRDQVPVHVVQEEEPLKDRLVRRAGEPAVHRLLGRGQKTSHERSTNDPIGRYPLILA